MKTDLDKLVNGTPDRRETYSPEKARAELAQLRAVVTAAVATLAKLEARCDVCGKPRTYKRRKYVVVNKPNAWRDACYPSAGNGPSPCHPSVIAEPCAYQTPECIELRAALEDAGAIGRERSGGV